MIKFSIISYWFSIENLSISSILMNRLFSFPKFIIQRRTSEQSMILGLCFTRRKILKDCIFNWNFIRINQKFQGEAIPAFQAVVHSKSLYKLKNSFFQNSILLVIKFGHYLFQYGALWAFQEPHFGLICLLRLDSSELNQINISQILQVDQVWAKILNINAYSLA